MLGPALEAAIFDEGRGESLKARINRRVEEVSEYHLKISSPTDCFKHEPGLLRSVFLQKECSAVDQCVEQLVRHLRSSDRELLLERIECGGLLSFSNVTLDRLLPLMFKCPPHLSFLGLAATGITWEGLCNFIKSALLCPLSCKRIVTIQVGKTLWPQDAWESDGFMSTLKQCINECNQQLDAQDHKVHFHYLDETDEKRIQRYRRGRKLNLPDGFWELHLCKGFYKSYKRRTSGSREWVPRIVFKVTPC